MFPVSPSLSGVPPWKPSAVTMIGSSPTWSYQVPLKSRTILGELLPGAFRIAGHQSRWIHIHRLWIGYYLHPIPYM